MDKEHSWINNVPSKSSFTFEGKSGGTSFNSFKKLLHFFLKEKLRKSDGSGNPE